MTFLLWAALAAGPPKQKAAAALKQKVDAEAVYKKHCVVCHAPDGKGHQDFEPPDFTEGQWQQSIRDQEMREAILNGSPPMPGFKDKLSEAAVDALVKKVRAFGKKK